MNSVWQDLRYAVRTLSRTPGMTIIATVTLALTIGANTAVFSLVHAFILQPLPFRDPSRLVAVWDTYPPQFRKLGASPVEIDAWAAQSDLFENTAWYRYPLKRLDLAESGHEPLEVHATCVPDRFFSTLGASAVLGRTFSSSEEPDSVILSSLLWRSRFGGDPAILGKTIALDEKPFHVIGIMPADFRFPDSADLWLAPGQMGDEMTNPVRHAAAFIARLRDGTTLDQAAARMQAISQRLAAQHPQTSRGWGVTVSLLHDDITEGFRPALFLLLGAVAIVLLIACANISNLLLARAGARSRDIAIRAALGAGATRIVRQYLTESLLIALLGGALGLLLRRWILLAIAAPVAIAMGMPSLDASAAIFACTASLGAGIAFGMIPAFYASRADPIATMKRAGGTAGGPMRVRSAFIVAQVALSLMLVTGAGILVKSFVLLMHVNPGFDPGRLLALRLAVPPSRNPVELFRRLDHDVRQLPGVESVAVTNALPLLASRANASRFNVPGSPLINPDALPAAQIRMASPDYFRTLRIPLRSGRTFTDRDLDGPVVIVNETMARRFWPGRDAVGLKFITGPWGPHPTWSTIVGVVGDVKQFGLDSEPSFDLYYPVIAPQFLVVRASGDLQSLAPAVRRAVHEAGAGIAIPEMRTMDDVVRESARSRRWTMDLLAAFAGLALLLALLGVYGVMTWAVSQRTREIGIRMALGAEKQNVVRAMVRYGVERTALGIGLGVAGGLALRRVLTSLVFDVSTADPLVYAASAVLLIAAALVACYIPARRAAGVDPITALRWE